MPLLPDAQVIEAVKRACGRSAAAFHLEAKRGLNRLATIAATAPFVGLFGTVLGMINSFRGCSGERHACLAATVGLLSESLVPNALGLLVAISALWCYKYLSERLESIDIEMENGNFELLQHLARQRARPG